MNVVVKHMSDSGKNITANTEKVKKHNKTYYSEIDDKRNEITLYSQKNKEDSVLENRADRKVQCNDLKINIEVHYKHKSSTAYHNADKHKRAVGKRFVHKELEAGNPDGYYHYNVNYTDKDRLLEILLESSKEFIKTKHGCSRMNFLIT